MIDLAAIPRTRWLIDGRPSRDRCMTRIWHDLEWRGAQRDDGPSPAGNPGPYWHVPTRTLGTTHRLYPVPGRWRRNLCRAIEQGVAVRVIVDRDREALAEAMRGAYERLVRRSEESTLRNLAEVAGLEGTSAISWRHGAVPNAWTVTALCDAAGVPLGEFWGWVDEHRSER